MTKPIKPQSIRFTLMLLYVQLVLMAFAVALNTRLLLSPTAEEIETLKLDELSNMQMLGIYFNMLLPIAAVYFTIRFINRKQRMPAILATVLILWLTLSSPIGLVLGLITLLLLLTRTSKEYFGSGSQIAVSGRAAGSANRVEAREAREARDDDDSGESVEAGTRSDDSPAAVSRSRLDPVVEIRQAGPDDAETIHALMMQAFEEYRVAIPPSSALEETVESVRDALLRNEGAAILTEDGEPVAMVRYEIAGDTIHFFRLSVIPARRRRGYAKRLVKWIEHLGVSKGLYYSRCKVRQSVQNNVVMYQNMGYEIVHQELDVRPAGTVKTLHLEKNLGV